MTPSREEIAASARGLIPGPDVLPHEVFICTHAAPFSPQRMADGGFRVAYHESEGTGICETCGVDVGCHKVETIEVP
jgi:hypothetical protein